MSHFWATTSLILLNVYHWEMAVVASGMDIDSLRCASMPFACRIVAMDSSLIAAVNSNSYSIRSNVLPATEARSASAAGPIVAVGCN